MLIQGLGARYIPGELRVALDDIDSTDCVRTKEAECHQAKSKHEHNPGIFVLIIACNTEDDGADQSAYGGKDQVE